MVLKNGSAQHTCFPISKCRVMKFVVLIVLGAVFLKFKQPVFYMHASNFLFLVCSKITEACLIKLINISAECEQEVTVKLQMAILLKRSIYFKVS